MRTADLRTASDADWAEAHRREKIIRPLASMTRVPGDVAAQAMVQLELGRARFHKLLQLYRASPAAASLLPRPRGREKGEQRLSAAAARLPPPHARAVRCFSRYVHAARRSPQAGLVG